MNYLHFDTSLREDLTTDSFSCEMKIANPLRNVKKIYLKSLEMPVGFFNIRQTQYFEFALSYVNFTQINSKTLRVFAYKPTYENIYLMSGQGDTGDFFSYTQPTSTVLTPQQQNAFKVSIAIIPGNYSITSLLSYINEKIERIFQGHEPTFVQTLGLPERPKFSLTTVDSTDSSIFPVGYVRASFNTTYAWIIETDFNYKYLGFTSYNKSNVQRLQGNTEAFYIDGFRPWNIHQDLCIYLYFENIPHSNNHFKNNLASFKIPIKSGYQAIEYNAENISFAQYIENTDVNYILDKIKLKIYDRYNNIIISNGYDFKFTLGIETANI
jgi:hypothetical protein